MTERQMILAAVLVILLLFVWTALDNYPFGANRPTEQANDGPSYSLRIEFDQKLREHEIKLTGLRIQVQDLQQALVVYKKMIDRIVGQRRVTFQRADGKSWSFGLGPPSPLLPNGVPIRKSTGATTETAKGATP